MIDASFGPPREEAAAHGHKKKMEDGSGLGHVGQWTDLGVLGVGTRSETSKAGSELGERESERHDELTSFRNQKASSPGCPSNPIPHLLSSSPVSREAGVM
jgi:hypothetical protein